MALPLLFATVLLCWGSAQAATDPTTCSAAWNFPTESQVNGLPDLVLTKTFDGSMQAQVTLTGHLRWWATGNGYVRHQLPDGFAPGETVACQAVVDSRTEVIQVVKCTVGEDKYCTGSGYLMANAYKLRGTVTFAACQWWTEDLSPCTGCYGSAGLVLGSSVPNRLPTSALSASSGANTLSAARLFTSAGVLPPLVGPANLVPWAWTPSTLQLGGDDPWIQVDMGAVRQMCRIITQGRDDKRGYEGFLGFKSTDLASPLHSQYVKEYEVHHRNSASEDWVVEPTLFEGNTDRGTPVFHTLNFSARFIRLVPKSCSADYVTGMKTCALRFELLYNI